MKKICFIFTIIMFLSFADITNGEIIIILKNGRTIKTESVTFNNNQIIFYRNKAEIRFNISDVRAITSAEPEIETVKQDSNASGVSNIEDSGMEINDISETANPSREVLLRKRNELKKRLHKAQECHKLYGSIAVLLEERAQLWLLEGDATIAELKAYADGDPQRYREKLQKRIHIQSQRKALGLQIKDTERKLRELGCE